MIATVDRIPKHELIASRDEQYLYTLPAFDAMLMVVRTVPIIDLAGHVVYLLTNGQFPEWSWEMQPEYPLSWRDTGHYKVTVGLAIRPTDHSNWSLVEALLEIQSRADWRRPRARNLNAQTYERGALRVVQLLLDKTPQGV